MGTVERERERKRNRSKVPVTTGEGFRKKKYKLRASFFSVLLCQCLNYFIHMRSIITTCIHTVDEGTTLLQCALEVS